MIDGTDVLLALITVLEAWQLSRMSDNEKRLSRIEGILSERKKDGTVPIG